MENLYTDMTFWSACGVLGFVVYIVNYVALINGKVRGNSAGYICLNIVAATLVLIGLTENFNLGSALIQITWIAIGSLRLVTMFVSHCMKRRSWV